ncbi:uncharacterized protein M6B38_179940 [Iris pallida]|uniref:Uncharacterized protein n=1 Tax=Iris pallida TaxID=29817 RepID=A0AAX6ENS4_IRIPA|nr:uncharacterized protein M6B38_179940 [Iris pallida]
MSIAFEIGRSEFSLLPIRAPPEIAAPPASPAAESSSSESSSIGKNSESWGSGDGDSSKEEEEEEVQSAYKEGSSVCALDSLEEALPMRVPKDGCNLDPSACGLYSHSKRRPINWKTLDQRGISSCYQGKSKSFSSLSDAITSCNSASDFAKPENAYTRRRRNEVAKKIYLSKTTSTNQLRTGGGISKRFPTSRSTLALAAAMNNSKNLGEQETQQQQHRLPPLHPSRRKSDDGSPISSSPPQYCSFSTRSFSLADIEGMAASGSSIGLEDGRTRFY